MIKQFSLDRCRNPVVWFGRQEASLMLEYGHIQAAAYPATALKIAGVNTAIVIFLYTGMRPGSLAPSHPDYEEENKVCTQ